MKKSRILWIVWLLLAWNYYFFVDDYSGIFILLLSVLIPLMMGILTKLGVKKLEAFITAANIGQKGENSSIGIIVKNKGWMPMDRLVCTIQKENLLTGETVTFPVRMSVPARQKTEQEDILFSKHCGKIRLSLKRITVYDLFGLFRFRVKVQEEAGTLFLPRTFGMETEIAYGESMSLDSTEYSMRMAGFDPSETFAIREYQQGDSIRQIHWKLSEKMESMMVRDYGFPIQNTILLLLETGKPSQDAKWAGCLDALAEGIVSLSQELAEQQMIHSLGWYNHEESSFSCVEITSRDDLMGVLHAMLGAASKEDSVSVLGHYLEQHEQCEFAHIVVFTCYHLQDIAAVEQQCLITEVLCKPDGGGGYTNNGNRIVSVNPETIEQDLAYLEI